MTAAPPPSRLVLCAARLARVLALALLVAAYLGAGCARRAQPVATLLEKHGSVERAAGAGWRAVELGARFELGDVLRTGPRSGARLALWDGSMLRVSDNARLRFARGVASDRAAPGLDFELGAAEIERAETSLYLQTPAGRARVERGGHARVRSDGNTVTFEVLVGRAVMLRPDGELVVEAGQSVRIQFGGAIVERLSLRIGDAILEPAPPVAPPPVAAIAVPRTRAAPGGRLREAGKQPLPASSDAAAPIEEESDLTLDAGESAVLHDSKRALAVRLRFDHVCPAEGVVEIGKRGHRARLAGAGAVVVRLRQTVQSYRLRCLGDPASSRARAWGVLSLRRDTGNVPLSRRAPANTIEADGRRYTVLYQTRLPALTLAWPQAPASPGPCELHVESATAARTIPVAGAEQRMESGTLAEGTYSFWYATADGRRSPRTTVTIRFDNAAPTAQFFSTARLAGLGGTVPVDGVTVRGAKVSAGGTMLAVDDHGRFRGDVALEPGHDAVAVRLEHPRTGIHYYFRRRR